MRFSKISVTRNAVTLSRETKDDAGTEETTITSRQAPLSSFTDALQAFKGFVRGLLPFKVTDEQLTITTLNMSEDKNGKRGLIVTAIVPVPRAYDKPIVLNTPLIREGNEDAAEEACVLSDVVLELLANAEQEATRYANRERAQGELFGKAASTQSENAKNFDERAAAAEVASTRKPRPRRDRSQKPGVGLVANPDATELLDNDKLRQLLLSVERDAPIDALEQFTSTERSLAIAWATARQRELVGGLKELETVPAEPECLREFASATLADGWSQPKPPIKMSKDALEAIHQARL